MTLTKAEIETLWFLYNTAKDWRGSLVGNPDPKPLEDFDNKMKKAYKLIIELEVAQ